jgi:hypothetical protein
MTIAHRVNIEIDHHLEIQRIRHPEVNDDRHRTKVSRHRDRAAISVQLFVIYKLVSYQMPPITSQVVGHIEIPGRPRETANPFIRLARSGRN